MQKGRLLLNTIYIIIGILALWSFILTIWLIRQSYRSNPNRISKQIQFGVSLPDVKILAADKKLKLLPDDELNWDASALYDKYIGDFSQHDDQALLKYISVQKSNLEVVSVWGIGGINGLAAVAVAIATALATLLVTTFSPFFTSQNSQVSQLSMRVTMDTIFALFLIVAVGVIWPLRKQSLKRAKISLFVSMVEDILHERHTLSTGVLTHDGAYSDKSIHGPGEQEARTGQTRRIIDEVGL